MLYNRMNITDRLWLYITSRRRDGSLLLLMEGMEFFTLIKRRKTPKPFFPFLNGSHECETPFTWNDFTETVLGDDSVFRWCSVLESFFFQTLLFVTPGRLRNCGARMLKRREHWWTRVPHSILILCKGVHIWAMTVQMCSYLITDSKQRCSYISTLIVQRCSHMNTDCSRVSKSEHWLFKSVHIRTLIVQRCLYLNSDCLKAFISEHWLSTGVHIWTLTDQRCSRCSYLNTNFLQVFTFELFKGVHIWTIIIKRCSHLNTNCSKVFISEH